MSIFMDPNNLCDVVNKMISHNHSGNQKKKPEKKIEDVFKECFTFEDAKENKKKME